MLTTRVTAALIPGLEPDPSGGRKLIPVNLARSAVAVRSGSPVRLHDSLTDLQSVQLLVHIISAWEERWSLSKHSPGPELRPCCVHTQPRGDSVSYCSYSKQQLQSETEQRTEDMSPSKCGKTSKTLYSSHTKQWLHSTPLDRSDYPLRKLKRYTKK